MTTPRKRRRPRKPVRRLAPTYARLELFALRYLANGMNATQAYRDTHPRATIQTCGTEGAKSLKDPWVKAFLDVELENRKARLRMDGDAALLGISNHASGDIRRLFDAHGNLLPIKLWPDDIADCVRSIKPGPNGWQVSLYDKLKARELMAIAGGKLRQSVDHAHSFNHAEYLGAEPPDGDE